MVKWAQRPSTGSIQGVRYERSQQIAASVDATVRYGAVPDPGDSRRASLKLVGRECIGVRLGDLIPATRAGPH